MEWLPIVITGLLGGGGLGAVLVFLATRRRDSDSAIAERFDDASQLAQYIRDEVERQVAPIREELKGVRRESHEMHDAVRAHFTQLWIWDREGRNGPLPLLPLEILNRLGLGHFVASAFEDTEPTSPNKEHS
ncbi:hypothetical protein ACIGCK_04725 [Microbacterium sp. NPDC078428]|uniref:hypothetical protein n=1 Tax=Microbacterium sp. NPDC078428 TaxID=3364190 RepID=UPI0037CB7769